MSGVAYAERGCDHLQDAISDLEMLRHMSGNVGIVARAAHAALKDARANGLDTNTLTAIRSFIRHGELTTSVGICAAAESLKKSIAAFRKAKKRGDW